MFIMFFTQVKWYVSANHAGGYSYRLCKMPDRGIRDLTEECFQVVPNFDIAEFEDWGVNNDGGDYCDDEEGSIYDAKERH